MPLWKNEGWRGRAGALLEGGARFPLSALSAVLATGLLIYECETVSTRHLLPWILAGLTGIPLTVLSVLWAEERNLPRRVERLISASLWWCGLLAFYYWHHRGALSEELIRRGVQWGLALHLFIAFIPSYRYSPAKFWQYNVHLLYRWILSLIYALVLALGLAIALAGTNYLLSLRFSPRHNLEILIFCVFLFHPLVFLSSLGRTPEAEPPGAVPRLPPEVEWLCRYLLLPLVVLYLAILYVYLARVLFRWELPRGGVGYLVSGVATLGIFTFLLLDPQTIEGTRMGRGRRLFFLLLIPPLVLLFIGLQERTGNYGWTTARYWLTAYGIWIGAMGLYFLLSVRWGLRFVPLTLSALLSFTLVGPWSAFELPPWLQRRELERMLTQAGLLSDQRVKKSDREVPPDQSWQISEKIHYLLGTTQRETVVAWFEKAGLRSLRGADWELSPTRAEVRWDMVKALGLKTERPMPVTAFVVVAGTTASPVAVGPYDQLLHTPRSYTGKYRLMPEGTRVVLRNGEKAIFTFELKGVLEEGGARTFEQPLEIKSVGNGGAKLILFEADGQWKNGAPLLDRVAGDVLYRSSALREAGQ